MILANVQLDRLGSLLVARPLLDSGLLHSKPAIPILMYHSISDDSEPGVRPYYRLVTSPTRFREQMQWLKDREYAVIDLMEALHRVETSSNPGHRAVVLTFDDGFRDFLDEAWPVLSDFGFTASVFLPTAFISRSRKSFKGRECLTWQEVRALHAAGVSFGSHTVSHPVLYGLPWAEIRRELRESRLQIEEELQVPARTLAYPYAFPQEDREFVYRFTRELVDQGYTGSVTTVIGRVVKGSERFCVKRLPVNDGDDEALFISKVGGAYDWMRGLQGFLRHTKRHSRALRAAWHLSPLT